jgi:1-acyl-sn-glycerol-3-phosphate acyltransferase
VKPDISAGSRGDPLQARSPRLYWLFCWYLRWLFWRKFDAVRVSRTGMPPVGLDRPLIIYSNHPSWWDPTLYLLLAAIAFPRHDAFGPMDAKALDKYGLFRKFGVFGIDPATQAGAAEFLRVALRVLAPGGLRGGKRIGSMWITAEGAFTDPRRRPVELRGGIAHLARRVPHAVMLPLAIEFGFWNESRPEVLVRFGAPIETGRHLGVAEWTTSLEQALTATMDVLAAESMTRDPDLFVPLLRGAAGLGGIYDWYRRLRGLARGQWFDTRHESVRR